MPLFDHRPAPAPPPPAADDAFARFRCDHPQEVLSLLHGLRDATVPLALAGPNGTQVGATLRSVDSDRQRLALAVEPGDAQLAELVEGNEATVVAYLDAIKLQFDLQGLVLVRSARSCALQSSLPRSIYRFQRRNSFRVRTLDRGAPTAVLRHPALPEMQLALRIIDLSIGGCALLLPGDVPALPLGVTLGGVRLLLDADTELVVALRLQHASSSLSGAPGLRLGCELVQQDALIERQLQRYIDQTQKRRRLLALD